MDDIKNLPLVTIQKREKLNFVYPNDEKGNGGANHDYIIVENNFKEGETKLLGRLIFQNGPRNVEGSIPGIIDTDLLEIVRHRLQSFQSGPYSSRENAVALTHIEDALLWLNMRVENRIERDVLGTNNK